MSRGTPRPIAPLNDEQRALAESCVGLAHAIGRAFARKHGNTGIDFQSEALLALTILGSEFKPELDVPFAAFAAVRIKLRLIDCMRVSGPLGYRGKCNETRKQVHIVPFLVTNSLEEHYELIGTNASEQPDVHEITRDSFFRLVNQLPKRRREVIILRYVDELSLKEIAERLGISVGGVAFHQRLAISALREFLVDKKPHKVGSASAGRFRKLEAS